jgi:hypothetical protein
VANLLSTCTYKHVQPSRSSETQIMQFKAQERRHMILSRGSARHQGCIHVVEAATKAWALQPLSSFSSQDSELLRLGVFTRLTSNTNFPAGHHKHGSTPGDA